MTRERYIALALEAISHRLRADGIDLFEATVEQARNAFLVLLAREPLGELAQCYYAYGISFRYQFGLLWPAFQWELSRALSTQEVCSLG